MKKFIEISEDNNIAIIYNINSISKITKDNKGNAFVFLCEDESKLSKQRIKVADFNQIKEILLSIE